MSDDLPELTLLETAYRQALAAVRKEFIDAVMADKTASSKDMHVGLMCTLFGEVTHVLGLVSAGFGAALHRPVLRGNRRASRAFAG
jgi:hypothetical protein